MRTACILALLCGGALLADQPADRESDRRAIEDVIERLNFSEERPTLFVDGADVPAELKRLSRAGCESPESRPVWQEVPSPRYTKPSVQFISADIAVADLDYIRYGSLAAAFRSPVVAIMKRENGKWKIATLRVLEDCAGALRLLPVGR